MSKPFKSRDWWEAVARLVLDGLKEGGVLEQKQGGANPDISPDDKKKDDDGKVY